MTLREIFLQVIGIVASGVAAVAALSVLVHDGPKPELCAILAFFMTWVCGFQCRELFK